MRNEVARKSTAGQLKLWEEMLSLKYRQFRNPLERIKHIVNDGAVHMVDAYDSKKFSKIRIKSAVKAVRQCRLVSKIGRPAVVIGEKMQTVLDGNNNRKNCLKRDKPSRKCVNWVPGSSNRNVVHPANAKHGFAKSAARMANSPLTEAVAADGQSLPSVILLPNLKLPDDLKPLWSSNLEIWRNKCGWMESSTFKKDALSILLPSIKERRQRMSLDESHCLLLIDSHISRAVPIFWREFKKENVDVVTFVPHSIHICQPLDRGVFAVLKSELSSQYEAPSSSSSAAKRTALVNALQQSIHSALSPSVIKRAFKFSGVLKDSSRPVLMKLPQSSTYPLSFSLKIDLTSTI
ncbi:uncharacterized protein MONOS_14730 [Monocercomonoides exilis]|uniref:uncharacterized protein n=1 Tax=Monocercomonoides exilis TaxID=2049356 RepID=UPI00355994C0|nr:hypothetical protein MONOS_14730 [Monocercomonoides exilis]|eukprot:MONOS_14730.1-p1 / transcript=MONOS_14730.1 / gene=MONOS_14730 / organism=Monocercomonoides_exilis_PA203 / gene_product=unspecified product / transcript_product=unspecified product / location=Mono_scaffold01060:12164-13506(-) / protein_length=348 / sequence_SO=supercontig / SO=protein_coding / is_pseudo=false